MHKQLVYFFFMLFMLLHSPSFAQEDTSYWLDGKWPHENSTLPKHDKALYGRLDNGFRYIIQENDNPKGRIAIQLLIQAGSLMENDEERGIAHFLEHLAYNGTKNFPAGKLIPFFQSNGMTFGKDANAHTSLRETVYKLSILNKEKSIDDGLVFMHDVAEGILIADDEVNAERGVIISEKNSRDSEKYRARNHFREFLYDGTEFMHDTIGKEDIIRTVTPTTIKNFYDAWYRPDYMILVVVGNVDIQKMEALIKQKFSDLQARAPKRTVFPFKDNTFKGVQTYYDKYKNEFTSVQIMTTDSLRWIDDSLAVQKEMLLNSMANSILTQRLRRMVNSGEASFFSAVARYYEANSFFPSTMLAASTEATKWQKSLEQLQEALLVALKFGFLPTEVEEAKKIFLLNYERKVVLAKQEKNEAIVKNIIGCIMGNRVYQSWEQTLDMYQKIIENVTPEDLNATFANMWNKDNRILVVTGNADIADAKTIVTDLWTAGLQKEIKPVKAPTAIKYPYIALPKKEGTVKEKKEIAIKNTKLTLHEIRFANGLLLRILPTPFSKGRVDVKLSFGGGTNTIADDDIIQSKVAVKMDTFASIGNIIRSDVFRLKSMEGISVKIDLSSDCISFENNGETLDLEKNIEAMWTQYNDPFINEKDQELILSGYAISDAERKKELSLAMQVAARKLFWKESLRNEPITEAMAQKYELKSLQNTVKKLYEEGGAPVLNMVGDVDVAAAIKMSAKTFGSDSVSWPALKEPKYMIQYAFAAGGKREENIIVDSDLDQASVRLAFHRPLEDISDRKTLLIRRLVASILGDEMRKVIREKVGAAYSPRVIYWYSDIDGYALYLLNIDTQHENAAQMRTEIVAVVDNFVAKGVDAKTLQRMKMPSIGSWKQNSQQNRVYNNILSNMVRKDYPYIKWHEEFVPMMKSITLEEVNAEVKQAFTKENSALLTGITKNNKK